MGAELVNRKLGIRMKTIEPDEFIPMPNETLELCITRVEEYFNIKNPYPIHILKEANEIFSGFSFTAKGYNGFVYNKIKDI